MKEKIEFCEIFEVFLEIIDFFQVFGDGVWDKKKGLRILSVDLVKLDRS